MRWIRVCTLKTSQWMQDFICEENKNVICFLAVRWSTYGQNFEYVWAQLAKCKDRSRPELGGGRGGEEMDHRPVQLLRSPVNRMANLCLYETKSSPYQGTCVRRYSTICPVPSPTQSLWSCLCHFLTLIWARYVKSCRPGWVPHSPSPTPEDREIQSNWSPHDVFWSH